MHYVGELAAGAVKNNRTLPPVSSLTRCFNTLHYPGCPRCFKKRPKRETPRALQSRTRATLRSNSHMPGRRTARRGGGHRSATTTTTAADCAGGQASQSVTPGDAAGGASLEGSTTPVHLVPHHARLGQLPPRTPHLPPSSYFPFFNFPPPLPLTL